MWQGVCIGMHGRGACMAGCVCSTGACMAGGIHGRGACMAGVGCVHGRGYMAVRGMHDRGCVWQGAWQGSMEGGVCGRGACMAGGHAWQEGHAWQGGVHGGGVCGRYYEIRSMSGRYSSYWNAFLS